MHVIFDKNVNRKIDDLNCTHDCHLDACGYAYKIVCTNEKYSKDPVVYRGENAVEHFLNIMMSKLESIKAIMLNTEPLRMNQETETAFKLG